MSRPADVLIVGAGPAGSSLAWRLARRGLRTLLIDARDFPRSKPCGDALSPGATPYLEEMGIVGGLGADRASRLKGWRIRAPDGTWFEGTYSDRLRTTPTDSLAMPRAELDFALLEAATAAGALFIPRRRAFGLLRRGDRVAGLRARGPSGAVEEIEARFVVGADGLRSRVARLMGGVRRGRRRRLAVVARYENVDWFSAYGELRLSPEGVLGMAPTGAGRCNVTIVVPEDAASRLSRDAPGFHARRLFAYGVASRLVAASMTGPLEITGPFEVSPHRRAAPGALLVGDAAGYFDPFTGQGVFRALAGAELAERTVVRSLEARAREPAELLRYERALDRLVAPSRRVQYLIDMVISRPTVISWAAALLSRRAELAALLVDITGDRLRPGELLGQVGAA